MSEKKPGGGLSDQALLLTLGRVPGFFSILVIGIVLILLTLGIVMLASTSAVRQYRWIPAEWMGRLMTAR